MGLSFAGTTKSSEAPNVEDGRYPAKFTGITPKAVAGTFSVIDKDAKGIEIPNSLEWGFDLYDPEDPKKRLIDEGETVEVTGLTSMNMNVRSNKAVPPRWFKGLMTAEEYARFEAGEKVDAEEIEGRMCQVDVEVKDSGWPKVVNVVKAKASKVKTSEE